MESGAGPSNLLAGRESAEGNIPTAYPIMEEHYAVASDVQKGYTAGSPTPALGENLDELIARAREDMERAAKSLDFLAAAKFRDRMYELQKLREENRR